MKKSQVLAATVLTAAVVTGFMGCSGKKEKASTGVVTIEYLNHKTETEAIEGMNELIKKFEAENPNIKVTQTTNPDFSTVIKTRAQINEMPDVFSCSTNNTYEKMFEEGLIMDLTGQKFLKNINEKTLNLASYNGKNWRLPYSLSLYGLYVRTDIFEENGVKIPTNYDELMDACKKFQAKGITPFICADQDQGVVGQRMERFMGIVQDNDKEFKEIAAGKLNPHQSVVLNGYTKMQIDVANNTTKDSMGVDQESSYQNFVNKEGAMLINGTWTLATLKSYDPNIKVSMIAFPTPTGKVSKVPISIDTSFCISESTKNPEACLKFLEFLAKAENAQIYCDHEGSPNVIQGVKYSKPEFASIVEKMNNGELFVSLNAIWPSGLRNDMRDNAGNLIIDKDADAFIDAAAEKITTYYNK